MQIEKDLVWDQRLLSVFLKLFFSIHFITTDVKAIGLRSFNSVTFSFFGTGIISDCFHTDGRLFMMTYAY